MNFLYFYLIKILLCFFSYYMIITNCTFYNNVSEFFKISNFYFCDNFILNHFFIYTWRNYISTNFWMILNLQSKICSNLSHSLNFNRRTMGLLFYHTCHCNSEILLNVLYKSGGPYKIKNISLSHLFFFNNWNYMMNGLGITHWPLFSVDTL